MTDALEITPIAEIIPAGAWDGVAVDAVALDLDGRRRRRIVMAGRSGARYLLDLPQSAHLRNGDGLRLPGGGIVEVVALEEPLLEIRAGSAAGLLRLAWHIGNRHLAAAIEGDRILIRRDHVIAHMLEHQGAVVTEVQAIFDPESGAYHGHSHGDSHGHGHSH